MKIKITTLSLLFALSFSACIKMEVPIPPPPGGSSSSSSTGNTSYSLSMYINGKYTTFNNGLNLDTSYNTFAITGGGDSTGFTNMDIVMSMGTFDNSPLVPAMYVSSAFGTEYQSDYTFYSFGAYNTSVGFTSYPDTVYLTSITDTTISGTFFGTCTGKIVNMNDPTIYYDSILNVTNGKFYLRKQ